MIEGSDFNTIFSPLNIIIGVNSNLLNQLNQRIQEETEKKKFSKEVGEIFITFAPFLKAYVSYCNSYDSIRDKIDEHKAKNKKLKEFLIQQRKTPASGGNIC